MRRRELGGLLFGAAVLWLRLASAQPTALPVIGFLHPGSLAGYEKRLAAFREGLAEGGHVDGRNVAIEYRWGEGHYNRLPSLAADLAHRQVAVIVAPTLPSAIAAKSATAIIPIVFMVGDDPIPHGLAASLSHPGGNATGISMLAAGLSAKRLGLLRELVPKASLVGLVVNPDNPNMANQSQEVEEAARAVGQRIEVLQAGTEPEIEVIFGSVAQRGVGAVVVGADPSFLALRRQIVALAARYALPAIYEWREFVEVGGLASYGTNLNESLRQLGVYTGKVLHGARPADLPVQQPTKFELVINLKTAEGLGLAVPPLLFARADEVIE
jgi:putative tryptophan/tyrosine transport system substrate-binding protein